MSNRLFVLTLATAGLLAGGVTIAHAASIIDNRPTPRALDETDKKKEEDDKEDKVPIDKIPAVIVDAVKKELPDGTITDAEKEKKNDKLVYEMDVKSAGIVYEVKISEDGKFISKKVDDDKD